MQATKTEIQYPTESNRGYYFKIRVGIKHHGTKKKHMKKRNYTNKIQQDYEAATKINVSLRIWNGALDGFGVWTPCQQFFVDDSPWFTRVHNSVGENDDETMMKHQMFQCFSLPLLYATYQSSVALSNEHLNVPLWVKDQFRSNLPLKFITFFAQLIVHHALAFLHQPHTKSVYSDISEIAR